MTRTAHGARERNMDPDSSPTGPFAVALAAAALAALASVLLVELVDAVRSGTGLAALDQSRTLAVVAARTDAITVLAQLVTFLGSTVCLVLSTAALAGWAMWRRRSWRGALAIVAVMVASEVITSSVKSAVGRSRPDAALQLGPLATDPAFPSGHTLNSTVFLGILVAAVFTWWTGRSWVPAVVVATALVVELGIGASRVYLGYHWVTDVLGGWLIAALILALTSIPWTVVRSRRREPSGRLPAET